MSRERIVEFADLLIARPNAVFVWSMGLTQHAHGVDTVKALVNVGLARGLPGRPHRGLVPIRGHSGVQGGAEVGCVPRLDAEARGRMEQAWRFPDACGARVDGRRDDRARRRGRASTCSGSSAAISSRRSATRAGRAPRWAGPAFACIRTSSCRHRCWRPCDGDVLLLPATTRYESPGGGTETSTERRVIFSPEIPGRRIGSAKAEWWVFREVMARAWPDRASLVGLEDAAAIRREIAGTVPLYAGIETLAAQGDQVQWGGPILFADGRFATPDGKARFSTVTLTRPQREQGQLTVSTRRGKQFNSMVQRDVDPLTGATARRHLHQRRRSDAPGTGRWRIGHAALGTGRLHWPPEARAHQAGEPRGALA